MKNDRLKQITKSLNIDEIAINFVNENNGEVNKQLNKHSKDKWSAMENVLGVYECLRANYGQNTATKFSVFIST